MLSITYALVIQANGTYPDMAKSKGISGSLSRILRRIRVSICSVLVIGIKTMGRRGQSTGKRKRLGRNGEVEKDRQ